MAGIVFILVAAAVVILGFVVLGLTDGHRITSRDLAWLAGDRVYSAAAADTYRAYLRRHSLARLIGGALGIAVGIIIALRWRDDWSWSVQVGFGVPIHTNILVWWLFGVTLGTLMSESYRLFARHDSGVRRAALNARPPRPLPRLTWAARVILAVTILGAVAAVVLREGASGTLAGALLALLLVGLAEATQAAITDRPRPVSEPAATVDGRLRWFAGTSVAWLELTGAILGLTTAIVGWSTVWSERYRLGSTPIWVTAANAVAVLVVLACTVTGVVAILRSRVRPPWGWQPA